MFIQLMVALAAIGVIGADLQLPSGPAHGVPAARQAWGGKGCGLETMASSQQSQAEKASRPQSPTLRVYPTVKLP